jgi:hypothetical protein
MRRITKGIGLALAFLVALAAGPVSAHEHGGRAMGVVENVTPSRIVVRTSDGHQVEFILTKETRFMRGETPARAEDVRVGERAAVHGKRVGDALAVELVRLGAIPLPK